MTTISHCLRYSALVLGVLLFGPAQGEELASEESVRAAMVFNFLKFTEFPVDRAGQNAGLRLCTAVHNHRLAQALARLAGRKVGGRELMVGEYSASQVDCQVLYVESPLQWNGLRGAPALRAALTVSGYSGFTADGGIIELAVGPEGVKFDINLEQARQSGLHFAPQLLRLARQVHE